MTFYYKLSCDCEWFPRKSRAFILIFSFAVLPFALLETSSLGYGQKANSRQDSSNGKKDNKEELVDDITDEDDIISVLDEEVNSYEAELQTNEVKETVGKEKKGRGKKKKRKSVRFAPHYLTDSMMADELLSKGSSVDWDRSFEALFKKKKGQVVTPSGRAENPFYSIPVVTAIEREELLRSPSDILKNEDHEVAGLYTFKVSHFSFSPVLRGLSGKRVQILFDSIKLTTQVSPNLGDPSAGNIDNFAIGSVETVEGNQAVLHGLESMGGVLHYIPFSPSVNLLTEGYTYGRGFVRYSTFDSSFSAHLASSTGAADSSFGGALSYSDHGELTSGKGKQPFTGYEKFGMNFFASKNFSSTKKLEGAYFSTFIKNGSLPLTQLIDENYISYPYTGRQIIYLKYSSHDALFINDFELKGGFHQYKEKSNMRILEGLDEARNESNELFLGHGFLLADGRTDAGRWWSFLYGFELNVERFNSKTTVRKIAESEETIKEFPDRGILPKTGIISTVEPFVYIENYSLNPILISGGGRFSYYYQDSTTYPKIENRNRFGGAFQIGARIPFLSKVKSLKISTLSDLISFHIGAGFVLRPPSMNELVSIRPYSSQIFYGNPLLDGEKMVSAEGGFKWELGFMRGLLFYSYNHFSDFIMAKPAAESEIEQMYGTSDYYGRELWNIFSGGGWTYFNSKVADLHCVELKNNLDIKNTLNIGFMISYIWGVEKNNYSEFEPMSLIPPLYGAGWIGAKYTRYGLWGQFRVDWAWKKEKFSLRDLNDINICSSVKECKSSSPYIILNLRAGMRLSKHFSISFAYQNLVNSLYKKYGSSLYGSGVGASILVEGRI